MHLLVIPKHITKCTVRKLKKTKIYLPCNKQTLLYVTVEKTMKTDSVFHPQKVHVRVSYNCHK
jgi:hypothetical protein